MKFLKLTNLVCTLFVLMFFASNSNAENQRDKERQAEVEINAYLNLIMILDQEEAKGPKENSDPILKIRNPIIRPCCRRGG